MRTILKSKDFEELVIVTEYPEGFVSKEGITEYHRVPEFRGIKGKAHKTLLDGILIVHRTVELEHELVLEVEHDFPFLKMQFELEGHSSFNNKIKGCKDVLIENASQRLFFLPEVKGILKYPRSRYTLEINLSLDFLYRTFNNDLLPLGSFGTGIMNNQPVFLNSIALPVTPAMNFVIRDIINCPFKGTIKKIYLENKVTELLILQIEQRNAMYHTERAGSFKKSDIDKFHYARELIEKNMQQPCSLIKLAELTGLNDFKLKKGFKDLFGNTVFGYLNDLRMDRAHQLLKDNNLSISEIAYQIGYKHPQHFTSAFKKKFGYLPSELKK